ncbi:probable DEAD-box ATP-dependent RNA helicase 48 isoform X2 [Syzygium oleosum]|uniref:probable DEAD-box ATP-dependent RNA helicase 48 isoform X2 n=1 Tax=Syzygium oleosum TaxID=219896 RepID=UPI0024B956C5|nr:probable DEAD-box ATP-dependent RNA helicase 48 isoform X2 [Syzygium oleosum]
MLSSLLREHRFRLSSLLECSGSLSSVIFSRSMGGGPRTFPGGLNKWQWKRMHEKKAREKEKRLLEQEKQLYQARVRSEIRASIAGGPDASGDRDPAATHGPMSPKDHVKALADRFMKEGAEDLWNEDDGPPKDPPPPPPPPMRPASVRSGPIRSPIDLRKLVEGHGGVVVGNGKDVDWRGFGGANHVASRKYSVVSNRRFRRNESSSSESDSAGNSRDDRFKSSHGLEANRADFEDSRSVGGFMKSRNFSRQRKRVYFKNDSDTSSGDDESEIDMADDVGRPQASNLRWPRLSAGGDGSRDEVEEMNGGTNMRKRGSSASLGKYDIKIKKRVPLKFVEEETNFSQHVELIRHELSKKKLAENQGKDVDEVSILTQKRFDECDISPWSIKALSSAGYVRMTKVQEATLSLDGKDAVVKAKTGTGKSVAFLLPAIETVLKSHSNKTQRVPPIYVLILCPTRELASQIAAEARALLKYHDGIGVQTLVGGARFKDDQKRLESESCEIIVATPGRLLDHVENKSGISVRLMGLKMLIIDEADHLLDLGFRKDMEKIVDCLPRQRQSLLLSATMPKEVRRISQLVLKREHSFIDTVGVGCVETHAQVKQSYVVAPHDMHFQVVYHFLKEHILEAPDYKVIVFCTTGMVTSLLYLLLREMKMNVREMHSRKPQLYRTRIYDEFRESKRLILVTSDVSSRGINYPDVTLVLQVGIPSDREQYIHRLGRTGREGKEGAGILLLAPWEKYFLDEVKDLPIDRIPVPSVDPDVKVKVFIYSILP